MGESADPGHESRPPDGEVDAKAIGAYAFRLFSKLDGAVTAAMVHLGDRLGLYTALAEAPSPLTSAELADRCGLHERWVREWAYNQGAAQLIEVDSDERLSLAPEAAVVLATPAHAAYGMGSFHHLPETIGSLATLPESFRTGLGRDYDAFGPGCAEGIARGFEPWYRNHLVPDVLPLLDGVVERLEAGAAEVVDVGCGAGGAALLLGSAFPASRVRGYDTSELALAQAEQRRAEGGVANVSFHDPRTEPMPSDGSVDLVLTLDCIHDMVDPAGVIAAIRSALADDGTWLLVDIKAAPTYAANVERNPMAAMMYGISVLTCLSSSLAEPGGAGLGTLGLSEDRARALAGEAGFGRFERLDIDHPVNAFYEIRP